jgi:hypothetical protein
MSYIYNESMILCIDPNKRGRYIKSGVPIFFGKDIFWTRFNVLLYWLEVICSKVDFVIKIKDARNLFDIEIYNCSKACR